jgi:hypothetical protein
MWERDPNVRECVVQKVGSLLEADNPTSEGALCWIVDATREHDLAFGVGGGLGIHGSKIWPYKIH